MLNLVRNPKHKLSHDPAHICDNLLLAYGGMTESLAGSLSPHPGSVLPVEINIKMVLNPLVTNGLSLPYHLDESIFISSVIRSNFIFISFLMKSCQQTE